MLIIRKDANKIIVNSNYKRNSNAILKNNGREVWISRRSIEHCILKKSLLMRN